MRWLERIFGNESGSGTQNLELSEVPVWLEERMQESTFMKKIQKIHSHMDELSLKLIEETKQLREAEAQPETPSKLLKSGLASRIEIVKQMEALVDKLKSPNKRDLESLAGHHWTLFKSLERAATSYARSERYVEALFPENISSIKKIFGDISHLLVDLEKVLEEERRAREDIWYIKELETKLLNSFNKTIEQREKIKENEIKLSRLSEDLERQKEDLKNLENSNEAKTVQDQRKKLEEGREALDKIEKEMADLISPIKKALDRIQKQGSSERLNLKHKKIFMQLQSSPGRVSDEDISGSLKELKSHLELLGLKDKKKEKILDQIDHLIDTHAIQNSKSRQKELENKIRSLEAKIMDAVEPIDSKRDKIRITNKGYRELQNTLIENKKELDKTLLLAKKDKDELNDRLSRIAESKTEVKLDWVV